MATEIAVRRSRFHAPIKEKSPHFPSKLLTFDIEDPMSTSVVGLRSLFLKKVNLFLHITVIYYFFFFSVHLNI